MLDANWIASKYMLSTREYGQVKSKSQTADWPTTPWGTDQDSHDLFKVQQPATILPYCWTRALRTKLEKNGPKQNFYNLWEQQQSFHHQHSILLIHSYLISMNLIWKICYLLYTRLLSVDWFDIKLWLLLISWLDFVFN